MQVGDHRAGRGSRDGAVVSAVTRWFSIDKDGQPQLPGWYEILYDGEDEDARPLKFWWAGLSWFVHPNGPASAFGNENTAGERWRGLAEKPE